MGNIEAMQSEYNGREREGGMEGGGERKEGRTEEGREEWVTALRNVEFWREGERGGG